jgi:hypothetical protein
MKMKFRAGLMLLAILSPSAAFPDEIDRAIDGALGGAAGGVLFGPLGLVAGAVTGATAGPAISHAWGLDRSQRGGARSHATKARKVDTDH